MSVRLSTLSNGMRVITHDMPHLYTISMGVWVKAGARCEQKNEHGISHLLEHLAFKGTRRRSAQAIAEEIEAVGGDMNAATGMETTAYYARVLKDDVRLALDLLSDILLEPVFDPVELERERQVILQEIGAANDAPDDLVFEMAQELAYPDQALGRSILGTADSVNVFTSECVTRYRDMHYGAPAMILSAAGAVDHDSFVAMAEDTFGALPQASRSEWESGTYGGGHAFAERPLEQTHLVFAVEAPGYAADDFYALQVLSSALGGGMSSRLFQEVREKRGLCYSIGAFASSFVDTGMFGVYAATSPDLTEELSHVLTGELVRFAETVRDDEVDRARAQLKAGLLMGLESSSVRADQLARQLLAFERVVPVEEITERVDAVDAAVISRLAENLLSGAKPTYSAVGNINNVASYDRIAALFA